jgi:hypothetical protein
MKKLISTVAAILAASTTFAAKDVTKDLDWKTGVIESANLTQEELGARVQAVQTPYYGPAPRMTSGSVSRVRRVWQGFVITGGGYEFTVACPVAEVRHLFKPPTGIRPTVTVHGPIRYALAHGGKFYIVDEESLLFEMTILQKALIQPAPEKQ